MKPLRGWRSIVYKSPRLRGFKAAFALLRDLEPMRMQMPIRDQSDAVVRGAGKARPNAALILRGLLLLISP
jgi:hypothetical protein